jgi:dTMP kinase
MSARGHTLDKFVREASGFFDRVRCAYLARAQAVPRRFRVIDSSRPLVDVRADIARIVDAL